VAANGPHSTGAEVALYSCAATLLDSPGAPMIRIALGNRALLRMTGYRREELEGQFCSILGCDQCARSRHDGGRHWCQLFAEGGKLRQHCHLFTRDGRCLKVLKSSQLVRDERGELIG
jgi:PAS domain S-box-containing protein